MAKLNRKSKCFRPHGGEGDGCCREKERKETERKREEELGLEETRGF